MARQIRAKIQILEQEVEYYRTLIQQRPHRMVPHDCSDIRCTISFLEKRIKHLEGTNQGFPFYA
jgi:hypothetical protein